MEDRTCCFSSLAHPSGHPYQSTGRVLSTWLQPNSCKTAFWEVRHSSTPKASNGKQEIPWSQRTVTVQKDRAVHLLPHLQTAAQSTCLESRAGVGSLRDRRDGKGREKIDFSGVWKGKISHVCCTFKVWCYVLAGCFILDRDILEQFLIKKIEFRFCFVFNNCFP